MKKEYIKPQLKGYKVRTTQILAGSDVSVGGGDTNEQNARQANIFDPFGVFGEEEGNN